MQCKMQNKKKNCTNLQLMCEVELLFYTYSCYGFRLDKTTRIKKPFFQGNRVHQSDNEGGTHCGGVE